MGERPKIKEVIMDEIEEDKRRASLKNMSAVSASPMSADTHSIKGWQCGQQNKMGRRPDVLLSSQNNSFYDMNQIESPPNEVVISRSTYQSPRMRDIKSLKQHREKIQPFESLTVKSTSKPFLIKKKHNQNPRISKIFEKIQISTT